jgi:hypothetical protein
VAVGLLGVVVSSFAAAYGYEQKLLKAYYYRAVAMEIVDGEMEALAAGEWRAHRPGSHLYQVRADAARNLPDGRLLLTVEPERVRLEWLPERQGKGGRVVREVRIP